jgi:hypothetical protein
MTDKPLPVTDPHRVGVTFANQVVGSGHLNGVANFTLATANFTPSADGKIEPDLVISARLRMDLVTVQQLRDACEAVLALASKNGTTH